MPIFHFIAGMLILLFGRPLYWALVALLGFVIGFRIRRQPGHLRFRN